MTNIINMQDFKAPVRLPPALRSAKTWLVWRLVQMPGEKKPRKIPYYTNGKAREGAQGTDEDRNALVSFERAAAAVVRGSYSGVGFAMLASNDIVALDFDDCVDGSGRVLPEVEALCQGTYSEFSPSGKGIRAFFRGTLRDRKDHNKSGRWPFAVEVFCGAGYVTVTGNATPDCEMWGLEETIAPLTDAVLSLYRQRFEDSGDMDGAGDDWLADLAPKIGLSIEKATALVSALDVDCSYAEWVECGQSLHHEFDGSDAGFGIWRDWSRKYDGYVGDEALRRKWDGFGAYRGRPITASWLLKHAKTAKVVARYEALADWNTRINEAADDYDLREKVCPSIAKDGRLGEVEREGLAQTLLKAFGSKGLKLTIGVVRKLIAPPESRVPTVKLKRPLTEFGNAERMLDRFGQGLMYVPEVDCWYSWTGVYWRRINEVEIEHLAKETVRGLLDEVAEHDGSAEFYQWCAISQQAKMVRSMVMLAASDPRVMVPARELDRDVEYVGVHNGVIHLPTGRLLPPDPELRITLSMGCNYVPEAKCPLFERTLLEVFKDDADMVDFFHRVVGYSLLGVPKEDVMLIPFGNGSNGKSTVLNAIRGVFGTYARSAEASSFVADGKSGGNAGGAREDLLRLKGARFVYVNEPEENSELREGSVKAMTGGDSITARGVYSKESVEITPTWVVFMPTNHKPIVKGSDNGIWRRLILVPFERNFENDPTLVKDPDRQARLDAEREGVLAWIVRGAGQYAARGLSQPASIKAARESYRSQMDLLAEWLEECCETGPDYSVTASSLWASWESYAKQHGVLQYVKSNVALGRRLDGRFQSSRNRQGARVRLGIRLRGSGDDFFSDL